MSSREAAKMGDILASEAELAEMTKEYPQFEKFEETVRSFDKEHKSKGKNIPKP